MTGGMKLSRFAYGILAVIIFLCGMLAGGYLVEYRAEERKKWMQGRNRTL